MEIPTIDDYRKLETKIDLVLQALTDLREEKSRVLTSEDVCRMMRISMRTFNYRIPALVNFGMYKTGRHWRIREDDYMKYIESNKSFM